MLWRAIWVRFLVARWGMSRALMVVGSVLAAAPWRKALSEIAGAFSENSLNFQIISSFIRVNEHFNKCLRGGVREVPV